ncbi:MULTISPECIES: GNAT family N-acetyltransferase [Mammaliicoccus]|uniref:GNAT family N-acetyltransferase n=1 Tax=Mammaliicoccus TaxID=2803850 RepID=UPI000E00873F|nr:MULTISPECIES: GNAT family protein [Mammaliicoccus]SUM37318.1 Aminoglycoside N(6')-acetyltransferase [Mammaliicoccus fleurettii]
MEKTTIRVTENILLRDAKLSDVEDYLSVPFDKELLKMYGSSLDHRTEKSREKAELWIEEINSNPLEWVIDYEDVFIGQVSLKLEEEDNKARFAIGIFNPNYWGKRIGTSVTKVILNYGFNTLNLNKIYLRVLDYNERAINSYKKAGFIEEGRDRKGALINNQYHTDIYMGILKDEYKE